MNERQCCREGCRQHSGGVLSCLLAVCFGGGVRKSRLSGLIAVKMMVVEDGGCSGEENSTGGWWW